MSAAGVTWSSSGNCSTRSNSTCTSFDQVNQESIPYVSGLGEASTSEQVRRLT
ncbi:hypothetical protein BJ997_000733 [Cryobacterium roopkundense]|uniref:Uncharacterized protein n=1 Tax=Cryobacterium roopkundense TaxID=1001240 RepID=A0A7W8ZUB5_9MICO|nr:hypothetical protein [Cryobacterium roopkundense]